MSCTLTALAAVTGLTAERIHEEIRAAAAERGIDIGAALRPDYNMGDWMLALTRLGYCHTQDNFTGTAFDERETVADWIRRNNHEGVQLIMCTNSDDSDAIGHVFAFSEGAVVDNYTRGECVTIKEVPADYGPFRVKRAIRLFCKRP